MATEITATLERASKASGVGGRYLVGFVFGDAHGRFKDGSFIHTSQLKEEVAPDVFLTRSGNLYRVKSWSAADPSA